MAIDIMLPKVFTEDTDISGWLMSEKFDGVRGYWNGAALLSKHGAPIQPPEEFTRNFPPFAIEGEIWGGRGTFEQTVGVVKTRGPHPGWLTLKFAIFDVPEASGGFLKRIEKAKEWFNKHPSQYAFVILAPFWSSSRTADNLRSVPASVTKRGKTRRRLARQLPLNITACINPVSPSFLPFCG